MGDVVNLNQFRKDRARAAEKRKARDNRAKYGRTGADRRADKAEEEKAKRDLDGKKRDGDTPENSGGGRSPEAK